MLQSIRAVSRLEVGGGAFSLLPVWLDGLYRRVCFICTISDCKLYLVCVCDCILLYQICVSDQIIFYQISASLSILDQICPSDCNNLPVISAFKYI